MGSQYDIEGIGAGRRRLREDSRTWYHGTQEIWAFLRVWTKMRPRQLIPRFASEGGIPRASRIAAAVKTKTPQDCDLERQGATGDGFGRMSCLARSWQKAE